MKKKINLPWIIAMILLFGAFNMSFFMMTPVEKVPAMWVCYGFITFAFVCAILTPLFTSNDKRAILSLSLYFVSSLYLIATIYLSYRMLLCSPIVEGFVYQSHIFALVIYLIVFTICCYFNKKTNSNLEIDEKEISFIKNNYVSLKNLALSIEDKDILKELTSLQDLIHSSPKKTNESVKELENKITNTIDSLQSVNNDELLANIKELKKLILERNNKL